MTSRSQDQYDSIPAPKNPDHLKRGYGADSQVTSTGMTLGGREELHLSAVPGQPVQSSPLSRSVEHDDSRRRGDMDVGNNASSVRNGSALLQGQSMGDAYTMTPSRGGTLKKRNSLSKKSSVKRSDSRRSTATDIMKGRIIDHEEKLVVGDEDNTNSAYYTPVPTSGTPTEVLANRFQAWRGVLKDLIAYYREVQATYENRSKSLLKVSNVIGNTVTPALFRTEGEGGVADATSILRDFHKKSVAESNKAREIEEDVIVQLTGLRNDLHQKVKEIKNLSGDFKNSVEKEMEGTRKAVHLLRDALHQIDTEPNALSAKEDPFLVRLAVDKQIERQIEEENYLHRAYLNLEGSGRELESIVVGEIQKSYNALAGILRREADEAYDTIDRLRSGPLAIPRDFEWTTFVENDPRFVDPRLPLRNIENIEYPGKYHPAAAEVRAGMLERKSKYLKSYSPGWYVLSPTHLHEFKSADRIHLQTPAMSLFLPEQRLGTHSQPGSSSHKFIIKGRQAGAMHRGHSWVFRAESHETMLAWYHDIKNLTEKTGEERNAFVRRHARSVSSQSHTAVSVDSDGALDEDEADQTPYSASATSVVEPSKQETPGRPQPGGRFPSELRIDRGLRATRSPSSASSDAGRGAVTATGMLQGVSDQPMTQVHSAGRDDLTPLGAQAGYGVTENVERTAAEMADHTPTSSTPVLAHQAYQVERSPIQDHWVQYQPMSVAHTSPIVHPGAESEQTGLPIRDLRHEDHLVQSVGDVTSHASVAATAAGVVRWAARKDWQKETPEDEPKPPTTEDVQAPENYLGSSRPEFTTGLLNDENSMDVGKSQASEGERAMSSSVMGTPLTVDRGSTSDTLPTSYSSAEATPENVEVVAQKVTIVAGEVEVVGLGNNPPAGG